VEGLYHRGEHHKAGDTFEAAHVPDYFTRLGYVLEVKPETKKAKAKK
jgi:hypothetical protein